ncbi:MAG: TatD family hydrolase [Actinobacteria bacterium]|nr:TatD family hydrolase [Actinomycetota bacterium]MCL5445984.1 TatD family hydrolase [Actinomycetota bacterium]
MKAFQLGWIDSHCHIQGEYGDQWKDPIDAVVDARSNGVVGLVCVGTDLESSVSARDLVTYLRTRMREAYFPESKEKWLETEAAGRCATSSNTASGGDTSGEARNMAVYERLHAEDSGGHGSLDGFGLWYTAGVHPHDAETWADIEPDMEKLVTGSARMHPGMLVGIGECGLDYHYDAPSKDLQKRAFADQIGLANSHDLTLVIHARDAWDDVFEILESEGAPARTIMHCFTGGPGELDRAVALGAYISFSGIVTFGNAEEVREAARRCPLERLLVETDAPFLSPVPHRGKPNRPGWVTLVGNCIGRLLGIGEDEIRRITADNTRAAFRIA